MYEAHVQYSANSTTIPPIPQNAIKITVIGFFSFSTGCSQHHRHLSVLIHDKLSHLIHDKSAEGPIETRKLKRKSSDGWEKRVEHRTDHAVIARVVEKGGFHYLKWHGRQSAEVSPMGSSQKGIVFTTIIIKSSEIQSQKQESRKHHGWK